MVHKITSGLEDVMESMQANINCTDTQQLLITSLLTTCFAETAGSLQYMIAKRLFPGPSTHQVTAAACFPFSINHP